MVEIDKNAVATKLLWVDLEMTGLDPEQHVILEVAAIVTDFDFNKSASYEAVISQPEEVLGRANEWAANQHEQSGLLARVRAEGRSEQEVITEFARFITDTFGAEPAVLAGNSIHNDRIFIRKWWPQVEALLHYRMLDVSSWKLVMQGKFGVMFEKADVHLAANDIQASIAELEHYLAWLKTHGQA